MFKSDDNEDEEDDKGKNLLEKLEKLSSKIKLTTEKMSKVDETNFKLVKETQNIKNAQAMNTRNISLNKKALEEITQSPFSFFFFYKNIFINKN